MFCYRTIGGESGTGKKLIARAIHATSLRRHRRFCAVNCAALSDDLFETELFGHTRGAFTGAASGRPGLFKEADGGPRGSVGAGTPKDISFPVNATSRSVTVVLSWSGASQVNAVAAQMRGPGGAVLTPAPVRQQGYFTVLTFTLSSHSPAEPGTWRLTLTRDATPAVSYQLSVIADESCFHYDVAAPASLQLGEPLTLIARATEARRPVQKMNVRAMISALVHSLGNLLANCRAGRSRRPGEATPRGPLLSAQRGPRARTPRANGHPEPRPESEVLRGARHSPTGDQR